MIYNLINQLLSKRCQQLHSPSMSVCPTCLSFIAIDPSVQPAAYFYHHMFIPDLSSFCLVRNMLPSRHKYWQRRRCETEAWRFSTRLGCHPSQARKNRNHTCLGYLMHNKLLLEELGLRLTAVALWNMPQSLWLHHPVLGLWEEKQNKSCEELSVKILWGVVFDILEPSLCVLVCG